nr:hypothetical protein [Tanacetum cinerariifolium]
MASNKDQIKNLEAALRQLHNGIAEMKIGFDDKFQHLEDIVTKLSDVVLSGKGGDNYKEAGRMTRIGIKVVFGLERMPEVEVPVAREPWKQATKKFAWEEIATTFDAMEHDNLISNGYAPQRSAGIKT